MQNKNIYNIGYWLKFYSDIQHILKVKIDTEPYLESEYDQQSLR